MSCLFGCCDKEEDRKGGLFADYAWNNENNEEEDEKEARNRHASLDREQRINMHSSFRSRERRQKIRAPPLNLEQDFEYPFYDKTSEEFQFINEALGDNFIFSALSEKERDQLIFAMQKQEVAQEEVIIQQGSLESDFFYIIESGTVDFIANDKHVGSASRGGSFGELALLYNAPRAATCLAKTPCTLWKVDQFTFRHLAARYTKQEDEQICQVIRKVSIFNGLSPQHQYRIADSLTPVHFKNGDRIVTKGEEGQVFYIIQSGQVKVHDIGLGDSQFVDQVLKEGDWFGERALLTGEARAANVTAMDDNVTTICISRATFDQVIGTSLKQILERGMKKRFLMGIPLFAGSKFTDAELDHIADVTREICFSKGHKVAEIGKPYCQDLWIIRSGKILVVEEDGKIYSLLSGDYFGDKFIKGDAGGISSQDAIIEEPTTCWALARNELEDVIGDIDRLSDCYMPYTKSDVHKSIGLSSLRKYRILGRGAFGKVWLVSTKRDNAPFAMKSLDKEELIRGKQLANTMREKTIMQSLTHPFILQLVSSFQDEFHLYLLLELLQGGELFSVIHNNGQNGVSPDAARFYAACVLDALGHMHVRKICYRDLKPENVLIDADGYCVVVDFGFAKVVADKTYTLCGTPEYIAPEILMSKGHDQAVDYWSFGVLIHELLSGVTPFWERGIGQSDLFKRIVLVKYELSGELDDSAKDLVEKLLIRKPTARLGNLSRGHRDIKDHAWFEGFDFKKLVRKELTAPWKPTLMDLFDVSHYDNFRNEEVEPQRIRPHLSREEQDLFREF